MIKIGIKNGCSQKQMKKNNPAILLIQLGTPVKPTFKEVGLFLWRFLNDPRVIDIAFLLRYVLTTCLIIPLRLYSVVQSYKSIWSPDGSPLRIYTESFFKKIQSFLPDYEIAYAMLYDHNSVKDTLKKLAQSHEHIFILPLYPQYATSSSGAAIAKIYYEASLLWDPPKITIIKDFFDEEEYQLALMQLISQYKNERSELLVWSFHGVPIRHLEKSLCSEASSCQASDCPLKAATYCYRAQCMATAHNISKKINWDIPSEVVFQSRVGSLPWTQPNITNRLIEWKKKGLKHITIIPASFVSDCLETLEELTESLKEKWLHEVPDGSLTVIPCLNDNDFWVEQCAKLIQRKINELI